MAMEVAAAAMRPLIRKLGELLVGELNLEKRVRKGVKSLETELALMHATLVKVSEVPPDQLDTEVKIWAGKVRDLACNMEDAVDAFMVRVEEDGHHIEQPTNMKNRLKKFAKKTAKLFIKGKALHQISKAVEEAQDLAKELTDLRTRYMLDVRATDTGANIDPRLLGMYRDISELVGIEEERDAISRWLTADQGDERSNQQLKTISVVGLGGLGKTTLVKAVYEKIKPQFNYTAFVSVSRTPDMKKIFKDILYGLDNHKFENIHNTARDEKLLIDELREFLEDKRYLIIIDDIWDEKAWGIIKCALFSNNLGSRIITTTRNINVSEACCSFRDDVIYRMKPLSDENSQRLFYKRIFNSELGCPSELQEVSIGILKKCGGVPLAIIAIASLLASNQQIKSKDQWRNFLKSLGRGVTEGGTVKDMKMILSLSYYDMPSHLKSCLLYLSIFPEDHEIQIERLIWRWIAEGLIHQGTQGKSLFEIGESYVNELVNRSMIESGDIYDDKLWSCYVHDMVLDLICSLSSEANFVTLCDGNKRHIHDSQSSVRRLSLQNTCMSEPSTPQLGTTSMSQVRSISLFTPAVNLMPSLSCFQVLRVLDLQGCDLRGIEDKINLRHLGHLLHLRYLGLSFTYIDELPMEIVKLKFLQTLDIRSMDLKELPSGVFQLKQLMRLCILGCTNLPVGLGNLVALEELSSLYVDKCPQDEWSKLGNLTELRVLDIFLDETEPEENQYGGLVESIGKMRKLQELALLGHGFISFIPGEWVPPPLLHKLYTDENWFLMLPKWINPSSLPLLSYLEIKVVIVEEEHIDILGMLPALRRLDLNAEEASWMGELSVERWLSVKAGAFPCLRECVFFGFVIFPSMFSQGAMPRLQFLELWFEACVIAGGDLDQQLDMGHLPASLEQVTVSLWCNEAVASEVLEAEEALEYAADAHPNHPRLKIQRYDVEKRVEEALQSGMNESTN